MHINVSEMYIIVHFEGFILHKSYLVKYSPGIKATHAIKRELCCCKIKQTIALIEKKMSSLIKYNIFSQIIPE